MNKAFKDLNFTQDFCQLPSAFYEDVAPQGLKNAKLVTASPSCAKLLGLDPDSLNSAESTELLSGNKVLPNWRPVAMKYMGHQFGQFNPQLGDGRGLLLAEVESKDSQLWDLHLKGSGTTPFSRQGDGRAVLRSSIREFLCSEAMAALGIPTSRALCVVDSETLVHREQVETGAMLLRVAQTHIRFGHFEFAYTTRQTDLLKALCDYVVKRHYPQLIDTPNAYADLFFLTAEKTASMLVNWQTIGFTHGVMNTDNMSILGDTFDYGPYGFMDTFKQGYISNHSDHEGRYSFDRQPAVAHWNLNVLARSLSPLVEKEALIEGLNRYSEVFNAGFLDKMRAKLGLNKAQNKDEGFIFNTLNMLAKNGLDYSFFFRQLSHDNLALIKDHCVDRSQFEIWIDSYQKRLDMEACEPNARKQQMLSTNPKYILRNHLAQTAIEKAQQGDYSEVNKLYEILQRPFDEQPENETYAGLAPDWADGIEISCSS